MLQSYAVPRLLKQARRSHATALLLYITGASEAGSDAKSEFQHAHQQTLASKLRAEVARLSH